MADPDLESILKASGMSLISSDGVQRVAVELSVAQLDATLQKELEATGLHIDETLGNKVFGTIQADRRAALLKLESVAGLEDIVQLKPHEQSES